MSVIPGRADARAMRGSGGTSPESITADRGYGFQASAQAGASRNDERLFEIQIKINSQEWSTALSLPCPLCAGEDAIISPVKFERCAERVGETCLS
jgi:hypothetical protein